MPDEIRIQCFVACCSAVHVLASALHGMCYCIECACTATPDTPIVTVHQYNAADGHAQTSSQAPVPLGAPATNGSLAWAQPLPNASSKLFKVVLRSHHGWQLDGHVRTLFTQSVAIMSVVMTSSSLPSLHYVDHHYDLLLLLFFCYASIFTMTTALCCSNKHSSLALTCTG